MENVTEELVRQNGNQAAVVMADYASQGGGGSTGGQIVPNLSIDWGGEDTKAHSVLSRWPQAGDILVVPVSESDVRYLLLVYIDRIIPESEFQVDEPAGYATLIGEIPNEGTFIHDTINSSSDGWHLRLSTTPTDGVYEAGIILAGNLRGRYYPS